MTQTRIFDRLPNIAGVHFDGFEDFKIESREIVKESIEDFLKYCKEAKGTAAKVILGEWGEGKTETYHRDVKPFAEDNGDFAVYVSASTLANCYDDEKTRRLMDTSPLTPLKLLTALFCGIRKEAKEDIYKTLVLSPGDFNDAEEYAEETLRNILGDYKEKKKIFIFIDEFEELLLNTDALKWIISGIKETINGQYRLIHENGKYEGCIHFLISCTPDAFYKLQVHDDISLISGGLVRRIDVIPLPEIRKKEGIEFLFALLKYSYKNILPDPLPIENLGVFALLLRISQSNLGVLVSLFTNALERRRQDGFLEVLNFDNLLSFLECTQVPLFGGQTPCIENETYSKVLKTLKDQKNREIGERSEIIFKLLIGELKPFSIDELEKRTKATRQYVQQSINIINEQIRIKEKIERTILKVAPLKEDKTFDDVLRAFGEYILKDQERHEKRVEIENYSELLKDFEDKITHYFLDGNDIKSQVFLPYEDTDVRVFFEGISQDKAREISNMVRRKLCDAEPYYLASEEILRQIFPTPVPKGLEFIGKREIRMKLWREVSRNLADQYDKYMPKAFLTILKQSDTFEIISEDNFGNYAIVQMKDKTDTTINALFYSINGDMKSGDIDEVNNLLKGRKPPIHVAIVIFTGDITPSAQDKILNKELGKEGENLILNIHLHPTLVKRIICSHRSTIESREDVDFESFKAISKEIISSDSLFETKISEWIKTQEGKGVVIGQITTSTTLKELSDSLKFYINFIDEETAPDEIYDKNVKQILKFRKYGSKTGFLPSDIESSAKMKDLSYDLFNNRFLESFNGKFKVVTHPVEKRILKILENEKKVTESNLKDYFIIKSKTGRPLENVFLNILEYKGRIKKERNFYALVEPNEFYEVVGGEFERYKKAIEGEDFKKYGHFYVVKERDENLIMLQEFDEFVTSLFTKIESLQYVPEKDVFLQQISLSRRLLKEFMSEFEPSIRGAYRGGKEILEGVRSKFADAEADLRDIMKNSKKWLGFDFELKSLKEYEEISAIGDRIKELHAKDCSIDELKNVIDGLDKDKKKYFKFDKFPEDASYFNIKLFQLEDYKETLEERIKDNSKIVERINRLFDELNKKEGDLKSKLGVKEIPEEYKISKNVLEYLKSHRSVIEKAELEDYRESGIKLRDIENAAKGIHGLIIERINELIDCVSILEDIMHKEKEFLSDLENNKQFKEKIKSIFDIENFIGCVSDFENELDRLDEEYGNKSKAFDLLQAENLKKHVKELEKTIDDWIKSIENSTSGLWDAWRGYKTKTDKFVERIKELLKLFSEKHQAKTEEIERKIEELQKKVKPDIYKQEDKLSTLESVKREIREKTYKLMTKFLSKEEIVVLGVLFAKYDEGSEWITFDAVKGEASERHNLNQAQVEEALNGLISKKYLRSGFSLLL